MHVAGELLPTDASVEAEDAVRLLLDRERTWCSFKRANEYCSPWA